MSGSYGQALSAIAGVHLLATMNPGPTFIAVSRVAMASGRSRGLAAAAGAVIGVMPWAIIGLTGAAMALQASPRLLAAMKGLGALYLLYLALTMWQRPPAVARVDQPTEQVTGKRAFFQTLLAQLSNPNVAIFFSAVFASLLPADAAPWFIPAVLAIVMVNNMAWYALVVLAFSNNRARAVYLGLKRSIDRVLAIAMTALACKLLLEASRVVSA